MTRLSIRSKLIGAFLTIGLIPLLVLGTFSLFISTRAIQTLAIAQVTDALSAKAERIQDSLEHAEKDLRLLSHSPTLVTFVEFYAEGGADRSNLDRMLSNTLRSFAQKNRLYRQVLLSDLRGNPIHRIVRQGDELDTQRGDPEGDLAKEDFFWMTLDSHLGEIIVTQSIMQTGPEEAEPALVYATAVYDRDRRQKGILTLFVLIQDLARLARSSETDMGNTYLIDRNGRFHYNIAAIGQRATRAGFPATLPRGEREQIISGQAGLITKERSRMIAYTPVQTGVGGEDQYWVLLTDRSRAVVFESVRRFLLFFGIMVVALTTLGIIFGITASHHFTRPIMELHRGAQLVAAGNFDHHIHVRTKDEIEELAVEFNHMADRLKVSRDQLTGWNEELKQEVEKRTAQLLQAEKMAALGGLSAGIAHEIGNPLASMKTNIQILEERLGKEHEHHKFLARILKEIDRLSHFFKTFSSFARPSTPQMTLCDIRRVIREVMAFMKKEAEAQGVVFRETSGHHIPRVMADFQRMQQVFFNLFLNALQAMTEGGTIWVSVQAVEEETGGKGPAGESVVVTVRDTGPGIPHDHRLRIFEPFYTTKANGTGLGLSIVHQIVTENRGTISVESSPGEGTTFTIRLQAVHEQALATQL
ncbi:MAG: ATP-binding protein [bacterium]|nr:ATP-binding protein [bacterium]